MARLRACLLLPDLALFPLLSSCSAPESGWRGELLSDPEELSASTVSVMPRQPTLRESAAITMSTAFTCQLCVGHISTRRPLHTGLQRRRRVIARSPSTMKAADCETGQQQQQPTLWVFNFQMSKSPLTTLAGILKSEPSSNLGSAAMPPGMWEYTPAVYLHGNARLSALGLIMSLPAGCMIRHRMSVKSAYITYYVAQAGSCGCRAGGRQALAGSALGPESDSLIPHLHPLP